MPAFFTTLRTAVEKRIAYERTAAELARMPLETAIDLDMDPAEAREVSHKAVYGY